MSTDLADSINARPLDRAPRDETGSGLISEDEWANEWVLAEHR